jgi:hypothetical protein
MSHDLHRFRRLSLHDTPPKIDLKDLEQVIDFCNSKHKNNVDYFGLACDLTASVHVGDIMSIDQPPQCPVIKKQVNVKQRSSRHISA